MTPPANKATFPTDAAARDWRATLSRAVDHAPVVPLYTSTTTEGAPPAAARMREEAVAGQTEPQYCSIYKNTKHARENKHPALPLPAQQRTTCVTTSEQNHIPDRCSCKQTARHAELSRRPCPCCNVVHIHNGTPSEQSHVPDRCSCRITARHAELSRRPHALCTRHAQCSARHHHHRRHSHWQQPAHAE